MNFNIIAKKIEDMIKEKIVSEGLVKTGRLLRSIKVYSDDYGNFKIEAEDYFTVLDEQHGISSSVFNSDELSKFIEQQIYFQINDEL